MPSSVDHTKIQNESWAFYMPFTVRHMCFFPTHTTLMCSRRAVNTCHDKGLGAFAAPLVSTHFSEVYHWTFHYIISLGIALTNTLVLALVFRGRTQDGGLFFGVLMIQSYLPLMLLFILYP